MSDLLSGARKRRQQMYRLEVLLEIERGERSHGWFAGKAPEHVERAEALQRLLDTGLIETAAPPHHFRLTPDGRDFLKDVRAKVTARGALGELDWTRADEIDFSKL
jgi:DNA-binding PadR family transcriptional regulator